MFRRLFAIETEALQRHADELRARLDHVDHPVADTLREMVPASYSGNRISMWAARSAF
ncbi:hypothetical protein [Rhizosaccharibacter radicis]|uniref:Uncharacterized protein n=1 Tax=Rhizosaccharibacter radicis TaxID=2782605 RepID=A0ABT1VXH6_9PROT|nr:hypothetical protein [Acetobacteraceae bacterium KSS12]